MWHTNHEIIRKVKTLRSLPACSILTIKLYEVGKQYVWDSVHLYTFTMSVRNLFSVKWDNTEMITMYMTDQPRADDDQAATGQDGAEVNRGSEQGWDWAWTHPPGAGQRPRQFDSDQVQWPPRFFIITIIIIIGIIFSIIIIIIDDDDDDDDGSCFCCDPAAFAVVAAAAATTTTTITAAVAAAAATTVATSTATAVMIMIVHQHDIYCNVRP